ncbi:MAG: hypothetical protein KHX03_04835 [Clostridium sp.]|nr:hypothetical protein [Clostridium sp.]
MSTNVQFGMLQRIKTQDLKNNPKLQNLQTEIKTQTDIFTQAKEDYDKASQNDNQGGTVQAQTFSTPTMSVDELEEKMNEAQEKLEKLQATLAQETGGKQDNTNGPENEDEKNKVKPKSFGNMMA